jgi:hypothetical protein
MRFESARFLSWDPRLTIGHPAPVRALLTARRGRTHQVMRRKRRWPTLRHLSDR